MDESPEGSLFSVEKEYFRMISRKKQEKEDLETYQWWEAKFQSELSFWEEIHTPLKKNKGLTKKTQKKEIYSYYEYEQELSKLQEYIRVTTRKYESAITEIELLRERVRDFDKNKKQLASLKNLNKKSHVCVHCSDIFKEICYLENRIGITKEVEPVKLTPGKALTHDQNEAILKQYISTLRQVMDIFPKPGEVDKLQAEVGSLAQTVVLLQKQFKKIKPDVAAQLMLEQKDFDIFALNDIIVKLQAEKEVVNNNMKKVILALNRNENEVAELTDSLAEITEDEIKFKSDVFEQEKLRGEKKRTAEQEMNSLDRMINQILSLTKHLQEQVSQLKATSNIECDEKLSDICITTNELKKTEKTFKNNLDLKMSVKDVGNKQIEAFAQKVSSLNQHRTDLEQDLIEHLTSYVDRTKLIDDCMRELLELLEDISYVNTDLKDSLAFKLQKNVQMRLDKDAEILQLQKELDKITLGQQSTDKNESQTIKTKNKKIRRLKKQMAIVTNEMVEVQNKIIARDEELKSLLAHGSKALPEVKKPVSAVKKPALSAKKSVSEVSKFVLSTKKSVPSAKKSMLGAKSKTKIPIDIDEELRQVNEAIAKKNVALAKLRKDFRTNLKKSVSSLPENPTRKTNTPRAATAANMNQKVATAANKNQISGAATNQKDGKLETAPGDKSSKYATASI